MTDKVVRDYFRQCSEISVGEHPRLPICSSRAVQSHARPYEPLSSRVVVPVANRDDAAATATTLRSYVAMDATVIAVHVIEKAGGAPDIASSIVGAAHDRSASAIAFTPRGGSRWRKLVTGDVTHNLVGSSDIPILIVPEHDESEV